MAFKNTTWWEDNKIEENFTLEDLIQSIYEKIPNYDDQTLNEYLNIKRGISFDETQKITLNNEEIEFNVINFTMDVQQTTIENEPLDLFEDQLEVQTPSIKRSTISAFILLFQNESGEINYIMNRPSPEARKMLRNFRGYTGEGEITEKEINVSSDFFLWLVQKVYSGNNQFKLEITDELLKTLTIETIIGIRGTTHDQNSVRADGDSVMNLISTLAFLLENQAINRVIIKSYYDESHTNIEIRLENNKLAVDLEKYVGEYRGSHYVYDNILAKLLLLVHLEILPELMKLYRKEKSEDLWSDATIESFTSEIKVSLIDRIS